MVWVLSRDGNERTNGFFDCGMNVMATSGYGRVSCSMWAPRVGDVLKNVQWRLARKNESLGVNERRWMLLCRVIHLLGAQLLWVLPLVSGALLDYTWVVRVWQRSTQSGSPWVGDLLPVVDSVAKITVDTRPTGDCRRWRIEVGTLVPGRCLGLGDSSCWETKGYLMKARPYVWLNPKGGMIARAVCPGLSMFPASFVVDRCTECRAGDIVCWVVASQQQQQQQQQQRPQYYRIEP